jgi:hypothetical protein
MVGVLKQSLAWSTQMNSSISSWFCADPKVCKSKEINAKRKSVNNQTNNSAWLWSRRLFSSYHVLLPPFFIYFVPTLLRSISQSNQRIQIGNKQANWNIKKTKMIVKAKFLGSHKKRVRSIACFNQWNAFAPTFTLSHNHLNEGIRILIFRCK